MKIVSPTWVRSLLGAFALAAVAGISIATADIVSGSFTLQSSSNVTITTIAINTPSGVTQGDFLLASIAIHDGSAVSVTPPTGWTQIARTDNDTNVSIVSYWKAASASEPASYTWTLSPQTRAQGSMTDYKGVDISSPIDAAAGNIGRSNIASTSAITTSAANDEMVAIYALHVGTPAYAGNFFSTPTGMTKKYDSSYTTSGPTIATFDKIQAAAGASGSLSSTISGNQQRDWASQIIALKMQSPAITEGFESYLAGSQLNGQNGGSNWTGPWTGDTNYVVSSTTATEGTNSAQIDVHVQYTDPDPTPEIKRSFAPMTSGTFHWRQRKDAPDGAQNFEVYSGNTVVMDFGTGSSNQPRPNGPDWCISGPNNFQCVQHYTVGTWDTADVQFDATTQTYRASVNGGPYSNWMQFENPATSVDGIGFEVGGSGDNVGLDYWDDLRISGN